MHVPTYLLALHDFRPSFNSPYFFAHWPNQISFFLLHWKLQTYNFDRNIVFAVLNIRKNKVLIALSIPWNRFYLPNPLLLNKHFKPILIWSSWTNDFKISLYDISNVLVCICPEIECDQNRTRPVQNIWMGYIPKPPQK